MLYTDLKWFKLDGASPVALHTLCTSVPRELPTEYLQFLAYSNGGEGELPEPYFSFCLDSAEVASAPSQLSLYERLCPGWFVFGGNGGLELFALDFTGVKPWPVLAFDGVVPFGTARTIAPNFKAFLNCLQSNR